MAKRIIRIVIEVLCLLILLGTVVFLIIYWKRIPNTVPSHFNAAGQIDGWSGKMTLIMLPIGAAVLYVMLSLAKTMRFRSMGKQVRIPAPELMFPAMKLPIVMGFCYMAVCGALVRPLGAWFLPVFLGAVFLPMIVFCGVALPKLRG